MNYFFKNNKNTHFLLERFFINTKSLKIIGIIAIGIFLASACLAQNCSGDFYDSGGAFGNYQNNEDITWTLCPDDPTSEIIKLFFNQFNVDCSDSLFVYDGPAITATLIGAYCGSSASNGPLFVKASNVSGCVTFRFKSDGDNNVGTGWEAGISCEAIPSVSTLNYPIQNETITFTGNHVIADNVIAGTSVVNIIACEVTFGPGFVVEAGATFQASIDNNNCPPSAPFHERPEVLAAARQSPINTALRPTLNQLTIFPNPFSVAGTIQFTLAQPSVIELQLLDFSGRFLQNIQPKSHYESGTHQVTLQNDQLQTGIYFFHLSNPKEHLVKKVMVIR